MAKEDPKHFGLDDDPNYKRASGVELADDNKKESKGFVAGTNVRASNKCYFFCK